MKRNIINANYELKSKRNIPAASFP